MMQLGFFRRRLNQAKGSYLRYSLLDNLYEAGLTGELNRVSSLISEVDAAINEDLQNDTNEHYHFIDNTIFDLMNDLDDLKASLSEIVSVDVYVLVMNEADAFLSRIDQKITLLKNNTGSVIKATIIIEDQASLIVSKYLKQIKSFLIDSKNDEALTLYNELGLDHYLIAENTELKEWQQIYKACNKVLKVAHDVTPSITDANASFVVGILLRMVK